MSYEINVFAMISDEICTYCRLPVNGWSCRNIGCPFEKYFEELSAKCEDISRDANYLLDLVADDDNDNEEDCMFAL